MLKKATYKQKFEILKDFFPTIIEQTKKDLKNEHLKVDRTFLKTHFTNKIPNKITTQEMIQPYWQEIVEEGKESLGDFLSNHWLLKHTDVYDYYASHLETINPDFDQIDLIDDDFGQKVVDGAVQQFGPVTAYIFAVLNQVVFSEALYKTFNQQALNALKEAEKAGQVAEDDPKTLDLLKKKHEREMTKLRDKYEKKLAGMEKKYHKDMESYKKQVSALQKKLNDLVEASQ